ncbi:hypothetical protein PQX77_014729 [Marasmius sp. AFHP31]|nr:hypothetical protein PQX77_014729 [Marasmius sp. AFHP31]
MESLSPLSGSASSQESASNSATSLRPEETPTQQHPRVQAQSPRGQFVTPPPFPIVSDGLFTPPATAASAPISLDSLFTPPPSPPRSAAKQQPRKKKTVSCISHVLIPLPPLYVQQSKRHTEAATAGPSRQPKGKPAKPPPLEIDVWTQSWADNHNNPYPDMDRLGSGRKKKKPGHLKEAVTRLDGPDFEDDLGDGDLEGVLAVEGEDGSVRRLKRKAESTSTSKRKRKRSPTYSYSQDAGPSQPPNKVSSKQVPDAVTSRDSTPASRLASVPPSKSIHASKHRSSSVNVMTQPPSPRLPSSVPCASRQVTPCSSLYNISRIPESSSYYTEDETVHFLLPPVWPPTGSIAHSNLAMVANTRFVRAPLPSGSLSDPIVVGEEPRGKTNTSRQKSGHRHPMAICPVPALESEPVTDDNGDEFDFVTHVLRFPPSPPRNSSVEPKNSRGSVPISSSALQGKPPQKKNKKTASADDRQRTSSKLWPASSSIDGEDHAFTQSNSGDGTSSLPLKIRIPPKWALSEKSRGKQKATASPVTARTSGPVDPDSFSLTDDHTTYHTTYALSYPLPESGGFNRPPPAVVPHPSHALTAPPDQAPFLPIQPPSPTFPSDFDPLIDYLGLNDDLQDFVDTDDPVCGPAEFDVPSRPNDPENGSETINPSILRSEPFRSKSPDLFGSNLDEETWTPSLSPSPSPPPLSPVLRTLYDGAKLPPRSVTRVVSLKARACPTPYPRQPPPRRSEPAKGALALLQDYDSSDSDEETGVQDTATNRSSENIFAPNLGSPLFSGQSSRVHDTDESSGPYWGEDSDETSSTSSEDDDTNQDEAEVSRNKPPGFSTQPTERGPYAYFYDLLPAREDFTSIPRKKIQWPTVQTQHFCHQCRSKSNRMYLACEAGCTKNYCMRCIVTRYEEDSFTYLKTVAIFECPSCSGWCTCDVCTTRRGEVYVPLRKPGPASKIACEAPLIRATDTANKSLDYWGPIYDATGETQIAKGYFSNGNVDGVVIAQPLFTSRTRRKVKRRVEFIGTTQPGWKRSSKAVKVDKDFERKRHYVGRRPPPPSALYDSELDGFESPLTDLDDEEGESSFVSFWYSEADDEITGDEQNIPRSGLEYEKRYLSRSRTPYSQLRGQTCDTDAEPPKLMDEYDIARAIGSGLAAVGVSCQVAL